MRALSLTVFLCSVVGLLGVFFYMFPAFAHQDDPHTDVSPVPLTTTASDVTYDFTLQTFVGHAAAHLQGTTTFAEANELVNEFRQMGDWNDGSTYLVLLTGSGGVQAHMDNRELEDEDWSMLEDSKGNKVGQDFLNVKSRIGEFVDYYNNGDKRSYVIPFDDPFTQRPYILIGGFDLQPEVKKIPYEQLPGSGTIAPSTTAEEVDTREELKMFVKGAIDFFESSLMGSQQIDLAGARKLFRAEDGPWRHISTYIWIMDSEGNVIFNGGNRNIEQTNLLRGGQDPVLVDIIERLIEASKKTEEDERFVNYDWDDPSIEGDEAPGGAGGSSPKLGYVESFPNPFNPNQIFIFGSGLYLGTETPEMETDDGGCAISGTRNTTQSGLFNLFLVMSVLFLAVSFKRRSALG